ncbi:MAG: DUF3472 domain-containing protein [Acidobacteria bacterium]|nr:DUF3472 domain-containing protein [Acidobacteriota bacterium]
MKRIPVLLLLTILLLTAAAGQRRLSVPVGGNSWITTHSGSGNETIDAKGWRNWSETDTVFSVYFYLAKPGSLVLSGVFGVPNGSSRVRFAIGGVAQSVTVAGAARETRIGEWKIARAGYVRVDVQGLSRTGTVFANVENLVISGTAVDDGAAFVRSNDGNYFYWGRRGPSVHLFYDTSKLGGEIEYFYNEVTVPAGNDVVGSYFAADGFGEGYFGFQVNSETERRVLFSVWSPFQTDDPSKIPADKKIVLVRKGRDVATGEFGNEGSGGQSFLRFGWKAGQTYRFLIKAAPLKNNFTNYTAWFYAPEEARWRLIASFSRPATNTYLKGLYSFLENFIPENGNVARRAFYGNQWARLRSGEWKPVTEASFSIDQTGKRNYRRDYAGGVENGRFFLKNCGFFDDSTPFQTPLSHPAAASPPKIDLGKLE